MGIRQLLQMVLVNILLLVITESRAVDDAIDVTVAYMKTGGPLPDGADAVGQVPC